MLLMLISIAINYVLGLLIDRWRGLNRAKIVLSVAVVLNLLILAVFKYADFVVENVNLALTSSGVEPFEIPGIALPIGISFFTFQALSYVIDVYRDDAQVQRRFTDIGLYIALFPQLIAGPIVRYHDIAAQIHERVISLDLFTSGVRRFVYGLAKKVLIANTLGEMADTIFALPPGQLSAGLAWFGLLCYTLQIYFDFSGYSDMAIGLGRMFGFSFLENFNYPYLAVSIQDFWRRWHISLSGWFRDYLYISLGGNRKGAVRTYINLMLVFCLCGIWHGASWNFLIWGLFHGVFLVIERLGLSRMLRDLWQPLQHLYVILTVMVGWVFFRVEELPDTFAFLSSLIGLSSDDTAYRLHSFYSLEIGITLLLAILFATPVAKIVLDKLDCWSLAQYESGSQRLAVIALPWGELILVMGLFWLSVLYLAAGTYNPFIYFRF